MARRAKGLESRPRRQVTQAHIARYLATTKQALDKVRVAAPERSHHHRLASDFLEMARAYYGDALHFRERGDLVNALSCVNYAHGWLDAGARLGLFDVGGDDRLFTLAK
jgi:hypothetical protein